MFKDVNWIEKRKILKRSIGQIFERSMYFRLRKKPDAEKRFDYAIETFPQAHGEVGSCFTHLVKESIPSLYITQNVLITSINCSACSLG